jgi:hypothetical protein
VVDALEAIQRLVVLYPEIASVDLNPALVTTARAVAVDIKLYVQR